MLKSDPEAAARLVAPVHPDLPLTPAQKVQWEGSGGTSVHPSAALLAPVPRPEPGFFSGRSVPRQLATISPPSQADIINRLENIKEHAWRPRTHHS